MAASQQLPLPLLPLLPSLLPLLPLLLPLPPRVLFLSIRLVQLPLPLPLLSAAALADFAQHRRGAVLRYTVLVAHTADEGGIFMIIFNW